MIVGIGSVARVGKDTSAEGLMRDLQFQRRGFADVLKSAALIADPLIQANAVMNVGIGSGHLAKLVRSVGGWEQAKNIYPEIRRFLERLGLAGRTVFGQDFWMNQVLDKVSTDDRVVIPDVRFRNEFDAIRERGGFLIKINRPGFSALPAEQELVNIPDAEWGAVIANDSSVMVLQRRVVEVVRDWLRK